MSSYLSFFIVPKRKSEKEEKQHIILTTFCRSSDVYQYFDENIHPVWAGNRTEYTTITSTEVNEVLKDLEGDITKAKGRLTEYEKYASKNPEYIDEIISTKEYLQDLEYTKAKISFIEDILDDMDCYDKIEELCCHIS